MLCLKDPTAYQASLQLTMYFSLKPPRGRVPFFNTVPFIKTVRLKLQFTQTTSRFSSFQRHASSIGRNARQEINILASG